MDLVELGLADPDQARRHLDPQQQVGPAGRRVQHHPVVRMVHDVPNHRHLHWRRGHHRPGQAADQSEPCAARQVSSAVTANRSTRTLNWMRIVTATARHSGGGGSMSGQLGASWLLAV